MSLVDDLNKAQQDLDPHNPPKPTHPSGWEPGIAYNEGDNSGTINARVTEGQHPKWDALLEEFGFNPDEFRINDETIQFRTWDAAIGDGQVQRFRYYRAQISRRIPHREPDYTALVKLIQSHKPRKIPQNTGDPMLVCLADWQLGKRDGDGTEGIVQRALALVDSVLSEIKQRKPAALYVACMGDLIESCDGHYCVAADTPILTDDLRWVDAGSLKPGDGLYALSEQAQGQRGYRYEKAKVLQNTIEPAEVVRVEFDDRSSLVCTPEHPLLATHRKANGGQARYEWVRADSLRPDYHDIPKLMSPWGSHETFDAGWLSGMFDGEGHLSAGRSRSAPNTLGIAQRPGPTWEHVKGLLRQFGYAYSEDKPRGNGVESVRIRGGYPEILRFLGEFRPDRLLRKIGEPYIRATEWRRVREVRPFGTALVARMETSSRTYIADGLPSHNSMQPFQVELDRRSQVKVARRLLVKMLQAWSAVVPQVVCLTVPGNHGELRRNGKATTTFGDNDDIALVEQAAEILATNPERYGHVKFLIPQEEMTWTLDIGGTVVGFAHGHQAKRGGTLPQAKLKHWWRGQMEGRKPIGDADLLVTAHYHHLSVVSDGSRTWIQCPTLDGGSEWFEHLSGAGTNPGTLVLSVADGKWDGLRIL